MSRDHNEGKEAIQKHVTSRQSGSEASATSQNNSETLDVITVSDLKQLLKDMRKVKWFFHFTRNNPMHTKRFYYALIIKVGLESWKQCAPEIRLAWEEAANSFDIQYGLIKAWQNPNTFAHNGTQGLSGTDIQTICRKLDDIKVKMKTMDNKIDNLSQMPDMLDDEVKTIQDALKKAENAFKDVHKTCNVLLVAQPTVQKEGSES